MERWVGKTVVVTGASSGIGAAVAVRLANEGMQVVGLARRAHLIDNLRGQVQGKGSVYSRHCDITKLEDIISSFKWIEDEFGGTDILVNNAAVLFLGYLTEAGENPLTDEQIIACIDTNFRGAVLCARYAVSSMVKRKFKGHIINLNSISGHFVPSTPLFNIYTCVKQALTGFTLSLENELGQEQKDIRVTSISPGFVSTEMTENIKPDPNTLLGKMPWLQKSDVVDAIVYIISVPPNVNIGEMVITGASHFRV